MAGRTALFRFSPIRSRGRAGELVPLELERDVPFPVKRLYTVTGLSAGEKRGFHAHLKTRQMLFCLRGKVSVVLESLGTSEETFLEDPGTGLLLEPMTWHEVTCLEEGCVLLVLASEPYEEADYVRDHGAFLALERRN